MRGFGSGEAPAPAESPEVNFEALSPTIEPLSSSLGPGSLNLFPGHVSDVGEVRLAPNPVDLSRAGSFRFAGSEGEKKRKQNKALVWLESYRGLGTLTLGLRLPKVVPQNCYLNVLSCYTTYYHLSETM